MTASTDRQGQVLPENHAEHIRQHLSTPEQLHSWGAIQCLLQRGISSLIFTDITRLTRFANQRISEESQANKVVRISIEPVLPECDHLIGRLHTGGRHEPPNQLSWLMWDAVSLAG